MGMVAIAAYVRQLRDAQGISREHLADMVGTSGNNIWRIEEKGQEPRGGLLLLIVQALKGSLDDTALLLREDASEEHARHLARERLAAEYRQINDMVTNPDTAAIAHKRVHDPNFWTAVERAAQSLADDESQ
jgi:transcriptional regulator with XRE-family HTH domain